MILVIEKKKLTACKGRMDEKKVAIPDGVKEIGDGVFSGIRSIESIDIPSSVTKIGKGAFEKMGRRTKQELPESVKKLGPDNFGFFEVPGEERLLSLMFEGYKLEEDTEKIIRESDRFEAAVLLTQSGKELVNEARESSYKHPNETVRMMAWLLDRYPASKGICRKAAEYAEFCEDAVSPNAVLALAEAVRKNKAEAVLEPIAGLIGEAEKHPSDEITIKGATGNPVEAYCLEKMTPFSVKRKLAEYPAGFDFDGVLYQDGNKAPEFVCACAVIPYLSGVLRRQEFADRAAEALGRDSLENVVSETFDKTGLFRTFLPVFARFGSGALITKMNAAAKKLGRSSSDRDLYERFMQSLCLSETREALLILDKAGRLAEAAKIRGISENTLRNELMSDFGFDRNGVKLYDLGGTKVRAVLGDDLSLILTDESGKELKSIPKKGVDPAKADEASDDFRDLKKNVKNVVKQRASMLLGEYASGKSYSLPQWKNIYVDNPVLRKVASLLVWEINTEAGKVYFMPSMDGSFFGSDGEKASIPSTGSIKSAHPSEMENEELERWKKYLSDKRIAQPFTQIFEKVYSIDRAGAGNRYKGVKVLYFQAKKLEKEGIVNYNKAAELYGISIGLSINSDDNWGGEWAQRTVELGEMTFPSGIPERTLNHVISLVDYMCLDGAARTDKVEILSSNKESITQKNIQKLVDAAIETSSKDATAWLLAYKNENYEENDIWADLEL